VPESITITDNRTGESIEVPIVEGGVDAAAWRKLLPNVWFLDPSFSTTAATTSAISEVDGENGILRYRGYPIEQLAEHSTFLEVAYLLLHGELPTPGEYDVWVHEITHHTFIHERFRKRFMESFLHDAHPMGMFVSTIAALSTFYPEAKDIDDSENRMHQIVRLIAKVPTVAAAGSRFNSGLPFVYPDNNLDFATNFLSMMFKIAEPTYECDPAMSRALDLLLITHADHGQNCSTSTARVVGSAHTDPYSVISAAACSLYGPRHGGANQAVMEMLHDIGSCENIDPFIKAYLMQRAGGGRPAGNGSAAGGEG